MESTFISIHDLTEDAIILYSSDSVVDILGYTPDEIVSRSVWEFFPKEEVPYAKTFHRRRVDADKAAVLAYCRIKNKRNEWISCECCFTVVYDVMVVCTSIYSRGLKSEKRLMEAPLVRRIFSSSPSDPRYHMLTHISAKFAQPAKMHLHEPRAALFLNRFTRTLTIMYATQGVQDIIGIPADDMRGRSFYFIISENCLQDAVKCLENAKANDSIAYLRFWYRDPRIDDFPDTSDVSDEDMLSTDDSDDDMEERGAHMRDADDSSERSESSSTNVLQSASSMEIDGEEQKDISRNSSGDSTHPADTHEAIFGSESADRSSTSSSTESPEKEPPALAPTIPAQLELEAVISCASDGLVVCLRRARPAIPPATQRPVPPAASQGVFAAPWATEPILPPPRTRFSSGVGPNFAPSLGPASARRDSPTSLPTVEHSADQDSFMNAIREQAIFAWALIGINGSLAQYGHGKPQGEALPPDGMPTWQNEESITGRSGQVGKANMLSQDATHKQSLSPLDTRPDTRIFGDPGLDRKSSSGGRSAGSSNTNSSRATPRHG